MANIQSGINQFINQAAILSRLAPGFEQRQEYYKLGKEEELLKKELSKNVMGLIKSRVGDEEFKQSEKAYKRLDDLYERKFQNKPTEKNYANLMYAKRRIKEVKEDYDKLQNRRAQKLATQQLGQKMDFNKFKEQLTVKDLPQNLQEKAYNEYTSKE